MVRVHIITIEGRCETNLTWHPLLKQRPLHCALHALLFFGIYLYVRVSMLGKKAWPRRDNG